ncbi:uncharacterized protein [Anoplolepis gracilipes]|uniref:uncharacterized protein isoform X1 n=1 Tax=Anoplolepis gracilipes TaxID=354296 RepID=UPI003BA0A7B6
MGALSLPFSVFLYLLPSSTVPNISSDFEKVTTVTERLNDVVGIIDAPKDIRGDKRKVEHEQSFVNGGSLHPLGIIKPIIGSNDATKLNVDFQAKVESKKHPDHAGISTNVQFAKQAEWLLNVPSDKLSTEKERIKSLTRVLKNENMKNANIFNLYIPGITDTLIKKFSKTNIGLVPKDTDGKNNADNHVTRKNNYIRLCRRTIDRSAASLMQKLRGKDCVKLPRSEFYLEQDTKDTTNQKESKIKLVGLKIGTNNGKNVKDSDSGSDEQSGTTESLRSQKLLFQTVRSIMKN